MWPKTVTPTTITVQWQAVSNAVAYQVKVVDLTLGQGVTTFITDQTTATVTGLTPGHWYGIVVQASRCAQGPFGDPVGIKLQSSIIIVDVILQRDCPGDETPSLWLSDIKQCTLKMTGADMYRFAFEDTAQGVLVDFSLAAQPARLEMETHAEVNCTVHAMDSVVEVLYNSPPAGSPALVRIWIDNSIFPDMVF
ncbi:fibronectin type III domain-containing protein, partial [candidate division KSB1 bacterium]|nr:fibronectin type III domain-containing protein [candidate division KSB1 bacterium]